MDVSPQLLREVEFREQWRGYNPDEVDDFLERLAVALAQLQDQLREAVDRATRAERRVLEGSSDEDELRRTLVLAQRTADAALAEAAERAAALEAEAQERSTAVGLAADEHAAQVRTEADAHATQVRADAEARVANEIAPLLAQRDALQHDVDALRTWAGEIRVRMADELRQQLEWLEGPEAELPPPPDVSDVELPTLTTTEPQRPVDEPPSDEHASDGDAATRAPDLGVHELGVHAVEPDLPFAPPTRRDPDATGVYDVLADLDDDPGVERADAFAPPVEREDHGDHGVEGGPLATAAADDPFLAELRRAVTDDEPLGPRDRVEPEAGAGVRDGEDDDDLSTSVFRRRRRQ